MEPLTTVLLNKVKANNLTVGEINWKKCIFCQENKWSGRWMDKEHVYLPY